MIAPTFSKKTRFFDSLEQPPNQGSRAVCLRKKPLVILAAIDDPVNIDDMIPNLIKNKVVTLHEQLVILVGRNEFSIQKRIPLGHLLQ